MFDGIFLNFGIIDYFYKNICVWVEVNINYFSVLLKISLRGKFKCENVYIFK